MNTPTLFWFRRDLRLSDHPGLTAALAQGAPVIPLFILDPETEAMGAAPRWRLGESLRSLDAALRAKGSRLILRRGDALEQLTALIAETGADAVHWTRAYDPDAIKRDTHVKKALKDQGFGAESHPGHILFEPWTVETGQGGFYKVYTPFWKAVRDRGQSDALPPPTDLAPPADWPASDALDNWAMGADMVRGAGIVAKYARVGEAAAFERLDAFIDGPIASYADDRDRLDLNGTSGLSENLTYGEISARSCWHAAQRAMRDGATGAETFLKELVWRDFAYHLIYHTPHIAARSWREEWVGFPWRNDNADAEAWKRGRTGEPVIDAAMRQLYVTGTMHNRARMLVASYLTKHLMTHWRVGQRWFEECLIDWDPASNAMGWQWAAGSGPDAAPYFRVFNPATQAEKFDPKAAYRKAWVAELSDGDAPATATDFFAAIPRSWDLAPTDSYPEPRVDLKAGREAALAAYSNHKNKKGEAA
ncbi:cryptochrome/photolyase family protein [Oceanibium sediminis]|uniref:cryptochrome/photolyase family protein n=1 Tax=Oceanibium sediminis TaxID=2026339 RepID=UPI000DD2D3A8|nr:deoxyribodipyrimidine photo-lyase [Oceanibium sediminis]